MDDLGKLEKLAYLVLRELSKCDGYSAVYYHDDVRAEIKNLLQVANAVLPDHGDLFSLPYKSVDKYDGINVRDAIAIIQHLLEIIQIEKASVEKVKDLKIFEGAEEKMKQAGLCFENGDFPSTFHSLNTAFELILKDKIGIPTTITSINTSNVVEVIVKYKVEPYLYLNEVRKRVLDIDNKIKHQGYAPSKIDAINGIKAMEDLIARLRNKEIELTEEVRNKICEGL